MTTACLHGSKAWMNSVHRSGVKISIYLVFRNIIANLQISGNCTPSLVPNNLRIWSNITWDFEQVTTKLLLFKGSYELWWGELRQIRRTATWYVVMLVLSQSRICPALRVQNTSYLPTPGMTNLWLI